MPEQHPINPPQDLRDKWLNEAPNTSVYDYLIDCAAQWGADQELEACARWASEWCSADKVDRLLAARRPKPPSLKEQALKMLRPLNIPVMPGTPEYRLYEPQAEIIRRALEQLDD
jgi:hypothetical protein